VQATQVHLVRLGEGKGSANEAGETLTQGIVETLDVSGEPSSFADGLVLLGGQDILIGFPNVAIKEPLSIRVGDALPKLLAGSCAASTDHTSDDLTGLLAQGWPHPALTHLGADKAPHLIEFQLNMSGLFERGKRIFQRREFASFFLSQRLTVLRATPKVRSSPRRLERSS